MKKNIIALMLVTLLLLTIAFTGCGDPGKSSEIPSEKPTEKPSEKPIETISTPEELEHVSLVWYSAVDNKRVDEDMVWSEINEYLNEKINVTLDYNFYTMADYREKIPAVISSGQYTDILFTGSSFNFITYAQQDAFYPIEDLIAEYLPETSEILPRGAWDAVTIDGHILGVPPYKDLAQRRDIVYNKTMTDKLNLDVPQDGEWSTFFDVIPFLYEGKEKRDADEPDLADIPVMAMNNALDSYYPHEVIIGAAVTNIPVEEPFYKGKGAGETVFNVYATDEYKNFCETLKKLVDDNIFPYDHENFDKDKVLDKSHKLLMQRGTGNVELESNFFPGRETGLSSSNLVVMTNAYVQSGLQALSIQTDQPERSLMFLELINTDKTLANMVRFGLKDQHYDFTDDGIIDVSKGPRNAGRDYSNYGYYYWYGWQFGNIFAGDIPLGHSKEFQSKIEALNDSSIQDTNLGFVLDTKSIANEIAACSNVISQYDSNSSLKSGMVEDVNGTIDEFNAKLEENGVQRILDEVQKQLTAWRASVGKTIK